MKFLLSKYGCLQNRWLGGYRPHIPVLSVLCPQLNLLNPPPEQNSWVRHWYHQDRLKTIAMDATAGRHTILEPSELQGPNWENIFTGRTAEQIHKMTFQRKIARSYDVVKSVVTSTVQMAKKWNCKLSHLANCNSRLRVLRNRFSCGIYISCERATETLCNVNSVASLFTIYYKYGPSPLIRRLSPTCAVVAFREFQGKSELSTHMFNHTFIHKGVQLKSKFQHTVTSSAVSWPPRHQLFPNSILPPTSSRRAFISQGNIWCCTQKRYCFFLIAQLWYCLVRECQLGPQIVILRLVPKRQLTLGIIFVTGQEQNYSDKRFMF
jgi:hypothetical protein